jgi:alkylhydroperoxidase/carboxymuconolactone decarboxylase family protein YurZ
MTGRVSDTVKVLRDMNPAAENSYRTLRSWIYQERPEGLERKHKELVMVVMNAAVGHKDGAIRHLKNALKHGLTATQIREALSLCFLFLGVSWFLETGQPIWEALSAELDGSQARAETTP